MKYRLSIVLLLLFILLLGACDRDTYHSNSRSVQVRLSYWGVVQTYSAPYLNYDTFGSPIWISDDMVIYSGAKLYSRDPAKFSFKQILPDSMDCSMSTAVHHLTSARLYFSTLSGIWSCGYGGENILRHSSTPLRNLRISGSGNYLTGIKTVNESNSSVVVLNLQSGDLQEYDPGAPIFEAFYHEDYGRISFVRSGGQSFWDVGLFSANLDGTDELTIKEQVPLTNPYYRTSPGGRYLYYQMSTTIGNNLFVYDFETDSTTELGMTVGYLTSPVDNSLYFLPKGSKGYRIAIYDPDQAQVYTIHNGWDGDFYLNSMREMHLRADGRMLYLYGWMYRDSDKGRVL